MSKERFLDKKIMLKLYKESNKDTELYAIKLESLVEKLQQEVERLQAENETQQVRIKRQNKLVVNGEQKVERLKNAIKEKMKNVSLEESCLLQSFLNIIVGTEGKGNV